MGIPDHLTCLLRNLYAGQEATIRTGRGTTDWFQIGKRVLQGLYCHPAYLIYMKSTSCKMQGWVKHKLELRLAGEISIASVFLPGGSQGRGSLAGCCLWGRTESDTTEAT